MSGLIGCGAAKTAVAAAIRKLRPAPAARTKVTRCRLKRQRGINSDEGILTAMLIDYYNPLSNKKADIS
jgi:hypothetical protein